MLEVVKSEKTHLDEQFVQSWLKVPQATRIGLYPEFGAKFLRRLSQLDAEIQSEIKLTLSSDQLMILDPPFLPWAKIQPHLIVFERKAKALVKKLKRELSDYPQALVQIIAEETTQQLVYARVGATRPGLIDSSVLVEISRLGNTVSGVSIQSIRSDEQGDLEIRFSLFDSVFYPLIH